MDYPRAHSAAAGLIWSTSVRRQRFAKGVPTFAPSAVYRCLVRRGQSNDFIYRPPSRWERLTTAVCGAGPLARLIAAERVQMPPDSAGRPVARPNKLQGVLNIASPWA